MFRFVITMIWGVFAAFLVFAASDKIVPTFLSGTVLALLLGLCLYGADTLASPIRGKLKEVNLSTRVATWFVLYEAIPAAIIFELTAFTEIFFLPAGVLTAFAMCLPISLITLRDYVDLSWLSR